MLSKDILENIQTLLAITPSINETYAKLQELEINNKKESKEYESTIASLKSSLELEKSIYDRFPNDLEILDKIDSLITGNKDNWINFGLKENINAILNRKNLIKTRMHLRIFAKMLEIKNSDFVIAISDEELLKNQSSRNILIINDTLTQDYINTLLTILNEFLNDEKYNAIRDLLLNFKYSLSFLYKNVEDDFLDNNFNINNNLYWQAPAIADFYHFDSKLFRPLQRGCGYEIYVKQIDNIIKIVIDEESSKQEIFDFFISEIIVRSSLLFLGDKTVNYFKSQKLELSPNSPHDEMGLKILQDAQERVDNVFANYDKDKELLQIINLRVR